MTKNHHSDCAILGGGVIGLSIAYELACCGKSVTLIERGKIGQEASWAGAGIFPPPATRASVPAWQKLQAMSFGLHRSWNERLREETNIDNGYRRCGGIHLARRTGEAAALRADALQWKADGVQVRVIDPSELSDLEPNLACQENFAATFLLPDEAQIRNPRHLQALASACRKRNVRIVEEEEIGRIETDNDHVTSVVANCGAYTAENYVIATGAWTQHLLKKIGHERSVYPVRGQMLLYKSERPLVRRIINEGPRYVVPREDGHILVGSTEEDVGFDKKNTEEGIQELRDFAEQLIPELRSASLLKTWAGLRPHAVDGFPYLGPVPHLENCFVAAGHYRAGLATSPGTAQLIRQLIVGESTALDISEFRLDR